MSGSEVRGQPHTPPPPLHQVVKLKDVFPHGTGFVLVFDFMLSDLSEVIRNSERPLTPAQVKGYMMMLLKGVAFLHHNNIMHRVSFTLSLDGHHVGTLLTRCISKCIVGLSRTIFLSHPVNVEGYI